jgi:hypothetical protein
MTTTTDALPRRGDAVLPAAHVWVWRATVFREQEPPIRSEDTTRFLKCTPHVWNGAKGPRRRPRCRCSCLRGESLRRSPPAIRRGTRRGRSLCEPFRGARPTGPVQSRVRPFLGTRVGSVRNRRQSQAHAVSCGRDPMAIGHECLLPHGQVPETRQDPALVESRHACFAVCRCRVSVMRMADTKPDANVSAAISHIAAPRPKASAVPPASAAPTAYPRSRHSR